MRRANWLKSACDPKVDVIAHSCEAAKPSFSGYEKRKKKQTATQARSIQIELPSVRIVTVCSFALVLLNPFPAIGSVSLAPKDAARTRLTIRMLKDAIREIAKGIAAQSTTSN